MSEPENQATTILLPASSVAVYSKDQETLTAARDIENDWRFARVRLMAEEGDIHTAIEAYKELASPDLIIVQTDTIDSSLTGLLEDLASNCSEGTAAIVIGPVNDVNLYRKLIDMGVSDYLVKPLPSEVLAEVIARTLISRLGVTGSRLIAFTGAKGGVGVSVLAQAVAWGVSDMLGQKTILIDAGGGWSTMGVGMGFEPSTTLAEAARSAANADEDSLNRMLFRASDKLAVLASGGDVLLETPVTPDQMEELLDMLMVKYPVVIADLSHAAPELARVLITRANQILVAATPHLPALRLARSLIHEIKDMRGGSDEGIEMIINMQGMASKSEVPKKDIELAMEFKVSATIPFAPDIFLRLESASQKITADDNGKALLRGSLLPLVQKVLAVDVGEHANDDQAAGGFLDGILKKLKVK